MDRLVCGDVGLRQDRGGHPRRVPRRDGGQAGRAPLPDDGPRAAALPHLRGAHARLPDHRPRRSRASRRKKEQDETLAGSRRARSTSSSARTGCSRRTSTSRTSASSSSTRSSASAWPTRSASSSSAPSRRPDAHGDAHPAHAPDGRRRACATCRSSRRRPVDRRAVRTIVTRFDDQVIREAVQRELARGGQVLLRLQPHRGALREGAAPAGARARGARIAVGHGQMAARHARSRRRMLDFVEGRYDVLASTAIVESGLDIPRANTIIIDRADLFGLSQLYQLRGRVGRAKERAYCYLVVPPANAMTDEARARIEALERHTELGSGFQIASLDLELRGAGDLLGARAVGQRRVASGSTCSARCSTRPCTSCAARRSSTTSTRSSPSTSTRSCPRTTWPTWACASRSTSASRAPRRRGARARPRRRDGGPLRPAAARGAPPRPADAPQDRAAPLEGARLRGHRAGA